MSWPGDGLQRMSKSDVIKVKTQLTSVCSVVSFQLGSIRPNKFSSKQFVAGKVLKVNLVSVKLVAVKLVPVKVVAVKLHCVSVKFVAVKTCRWKNLSL